MNRFKNRELVDEDRENGDWLFESYETTAVVVKNYK